MPDVIKEMQNKIAYYYKRIDECNNTIRQIQDIENKNNLTCEQTNKQTGNNKVLPKGWTEYRQDAFDGDIW